MKDVQNSTDKRGIDIQKSWMGWMVALRWIATALRFLASGANLEEMPGMQT